MARVTPLPWTHDDPARQDMDAGPIADHRRGRRRDPQTQSKPGKITHAFFTRLMDESGAMLWGRVTYEMMESYWPAVARGDEQAPPAMREWAVKLQAKPKYVVSSTRKDFPWPHSHHIAGDLREGVQKLKDATPAGVLLGSGKLATELDRLDLIDEYQLLVHPRIAGHGPTLYQGGLPGTRRLELLSAEPLRNGAVAMHYHRALNTGVHRRQLTGSAVSFSRSRGQFTGWGHIVTFAACTAARIGEVSGVRAGDIDRATWT